MKYEKPELKVEKFEFESVMAEEFTSAISPDPAGPVIEENDPFIETMSAFGEVFDFSE